MKEGSQREPNTELRRRMLLPHNLEVASRQCEAKQVEGREVIILDQKKVSRRSLGSTVFTSKDLKSLLFLVTIASQPNERAHVASRQSSKSGAFREYASNTFSPVTGMTLAMSNTAPSASYDASVSCRLLCSM